MSGKNLLLKFNGKMLFANQIVGFSKQYLKKDWRYKIDFLHSGTYLLKLQIDDVILGWCGQACPGMPKGAIKT